MTEPDRSALDILLARAAQSIPVPDPGPFGAAVGNRIRSEPLPNEQLPLRRSPHARPRQRPRLMGALVAGLAVACAGVVLSVEPVRSAVVEIFGVEGIHITRAAPLPTIPSTAPSPPPGFPSTTLQVDPSVALHLGRSTTLADAARLVGFPIRLPTSGEYQRPDVVQFGTPPAGGMASMLYLARPGRPPLPTTGAAALLTEFRGQIEAGFFQKVLGPDTTVEPVKIGSVVGYWLAGAPHEFFYTNPDGSIATETIRLAADTLLWTAGGITYRFESGLSRDAAVNLATSMR